VRNVKRVQKPECLRVHSDEWRDSLLQFTDSGSEPPKDLVDNYNRPEVRQALERMYSVGDGCYCCYCEKEMDDHESEIEHRKPREVFPQYTFDWGNLHLACSTCNRNKGQQWDKRKRNEILDAAKTRSINNKHLTYEFRAMTGVLRIPVSKRGETTVYHADLNRKKLLRGRWKVWIATTEAINRIKSLGRDDPRVRTEMRMIEEMCLGEYGSVIRWLFDTEMSGWLD